MSATPHRRILLRIIASSLVATAVVALQGPALAARSVHGRSDASDIIIFSDTWHETSPVASRYPAAKKHAGLYPTKVAYVKAMRDSVLVAAWRQQGVPYVWGGSSPQGFDCSGLLQWSFARAGLAVPRTAAEQATMGTSIVMEERWLEPGDLMVFQTRNSRYVDHIGMYLGRGWYIHASGNGRRVMLGSIHDPGDISARIWVGARRVFQLPYPQKG